MYVYSLIFREFSRLHNLHPRYRNSLLYGFISSWENSAHFLHFLPFTILQFRSTRYPSLLGEQRQYGMRSLPETSTHGQQWEWNLRTSDLESTPYQLGHMLQSTLENQINQNMINFHQHHVWDVHRDLRKLRKDLR